MFKRNPNFIVHLNSDTAIPPIAVYEKKFVIGRKPTHPVSIPDSSISRDHLEVIVQDGQIFIMDLETSNGTRLDGHLIPGNIPTPYRPGQTLNLGHSNVTIDIELYDENRPKGRALSSHRSAPSTSARAASTAPRQEPRVIYPHQNHQGQSSNQRVDAAPPPGVTPSAPTQPISVVQPSPSTSEYQPFPGAPLREPVAAPLPPHVPAVPSAPAMAAPREAPALDLEGLKQQASVLMVQIDHLKSQVIKYQTEKFTAEAAYNQESLRLEKLQVEIRNEDDKLKILRQELDLKQSQVKDAEEKHKMTVLANQSFLEETKSALEKARAREVELQTLISEAKTEHQRALEFAKAHRHEAEDYAKKLREETQEWSNQLRSSTEGEVRRKIETLQEETRKLLADRETIYQEMKQRQEATLEELKKNEALKIKNIQTLDAQFKKRTDEFEEGFRQKRDNIERDFYEKREILERELSDRRTSIERELLERREALERESAERRGQIENEAQELRTLRDREYKELKAQQDAYLIDVRRREEDRLKNIVEDSRKMIQEQFQIKNETILKTFNDFFVEYVKLAPVNMREHLPALHQDLQKVLKDALTNEMTGEEKQIRQLFEYDPAAQKNHKTYWKRFAYLSALALAIGGYVMYNPGHVSLAMKSFAGAIQQLQKENKQQQVEFLEHLKEQAIYRPEQTTTFKESYTDNVLYTARYLEFENDDQYKNEWIVAMKDYLLQEGKLMDDKATEILSKEGTLIASLADEIKSIDARSADVGISRMREKENAFNTLIAQSLKTEIARGFKEKKQSFYERFINDPSKARGPAGKN